MPQNFAPVEHRLSNGIPVVFQNYDGPVAATYWWINTGSADEKPNQAGFAHFLEHMLFKDAAAKDSGTPSQGKLARSIESLGGDINAYTSFDQTVYHVTCAERHWEKVVSHFGKMAAPQKFARHDFESEREVILEELKKNEDSPERSQFQELFSASFSKHPYGKPVIGYAKVLKKAHTQDLQAFYKENYISSRMGLIAVGPFDDKRKAALLKQFESLFGSKVYARSEERPRVRSIEPELRSASEWRRKVFDVKQPSLSISFRIPALIHEDTPKLDILSCVLGAGELSRLYQNLFYGKSLVSDVSSGVYVPSDPGMLYLQAEFDSLDKMKPVLKEMYFEMERLKKEGPTPDEIERVIVNTESERYYSLQSADGIASRLGYLRFNVGSLSFDRDYIEALRSLKKEDIEETAKKYLVPERMAGVVLLPKSDEKYDLKEFEKFTMSSLSTAVKKSILAPTKASLRKSNFFAPPIQVVERPSGLKVCHLQRPISHLFSVHLSVLGGTRLETHAGESNLIAQTWAKATKSKDSKEISRIIEGAAAGFDGFSGRNTIGLAMSGLGRDFKKLADLFVDVCANPTFPEDELAHSRRLAVESLKTIDDHSSQLCSRLFLETLFERHPYGKNVYGTLEALPKISTDTLLSTHRKWVRPDRLVISVVGAPGLPEVEEFLRNLESALGVGGASAKNAEVLDEPDLKAPRWVERKMGREQIHLMQGGLGLRLNSEERFAMRLFQSIMDGQSGRLFMEIREKKSLCYSVSTMGFEGLERGYTGAYIGCSPEKREEAEKGIKKVFEDFAAKGPKAAELLRAKELMLGMRAMELQSDRAISAHYGLQLLYGMRPEEDLAAAAKIEKITAKDTQKVCEKYALSRPWINVAVG